MNILKIHVFDYRIMNNPMGSYDRAVYKKLSSKNGIHILNADDGSYFICFSEIEASKIIPGSLLDNVNKIFSSRGGVLINEVFYHTDSRLMTDYVTKRWFEVLISDLNQRQSFFNAPKVGLTTIDDAPKTGSANDFMNPEIQQTRSVENPYVSGFSSPIEAALHGFPNFSSSPISSIESDSPFDDINWDGSPARRDNVRDSDDDETGFGYFGELECVKDRKAEKRFKKNNILTADKETIKHDAEIIRSILQEIAPGDEPWLVFWRAKMEKRIMKCMVITKDELEDLERSGNLGKIFEATKTTLGVAGSALSLIGGAASLIGRSRM